MKDTVVSSLAVLLLVGTTACSGVEPTNRDEGASVGAVQQAVGADAGPGADAGAGADAGPGAGPSPSVEVWQGTMKGGSAQAQGSTPTSGFWLDVHENGSGTSRSAGIYVSSYSYDPASLTCATETYCWNPFDPNACYTYSYCYYAQYSYTYAYGQIPSNDFRAAPRGASLKTDLSQDPAIFGATCSMSSGGLWACGPATGTIDISWSANGYSSQTQSGTAEYKSSYGNSSYTSRSVGKYSSVSANVAGQLLGNTLSGAQGSVSDSKGTSVSKFVFKD